MSVFGFAILCILALLASFYAGVVLGICDTKRSYGIPKGCTPEVYKFEMDELKNFADSLWEELNEHGTICP